MLGLPITRGAGDSASLLPPDHLAQTHNEKQQLCHHEGPKRVLGTEDAPHKWQLVGVGSPLFLFLLSFSLCHPLLQQTPLTRPTGLPACSVPHTSYKNHFNYADLWAPCAELLVLKAGVGICTSDECPW